MAASAARPNFSSSEDDDDGGDDDSDVNVDGDDEDVVSDVSSSAIGMESSDFDTDFEAEERLGVVPSQPPQPPLPNHQQAAPPPPVETIGSPATFSADPERTSKRTVRPSAKARAAAEDSGESHYHIQSSDDSDHSPQFSL